MLKRLQYHHIYLPTILFLWVGLFLDSADLSNSLPYNQWLTNLLAIIVYYWVYNQVSKQIKRIMLFGILVAIFGEVLFSLVLGMYHYRLGNIPLYVFLGHSLVYTGVYYMARESVVKKHRQTFVSALYFSMILYSTLWLVLANDVFGFLCMLGVVLLLKRYQSSSLFFLLMFFMVAYLELLGTYYQCWYWPDIWFNQFSSVPSANPPSGIGFFYFAFDAGCLWLYKVFDRERWRRFLIIRQVMQRR